jgi:hypothetical protein
MRSRGFHIPRQSANRWRVKLSALRDGRRLPPGRFLVLFSVGGRADSRVIMRLERLDQLKNPVTASGTKPKASYYIRVCIIISYLICQCLPVFESVCCYKILLKQIPNSERVYAAVMPQFIFWWCSVGIPVQLSAVLSEAYSDIPQSLLVSARATPPSVYECFLPNPLNFFIYRLSYRHTRKITYSMLCVV